MKKIKLLVPALSIASVGAVVVPVVTSCSKSVTLALTELGQGIYMFDGYPDVETKTTYIYTGVKMVEGANAVAVMTASTDEGATGEFIKPSSIKVNGKSCKVEEEISEQGVKGYYAKFTDTITAGTEIKVEVTYSQGAKKCLHMVGIGTHA